MNNENTIPLEYSGKAVRMPTASDLKNSRPSGVVR